MATLAMWLVALMVIASCASTENDGPIDTGGESNVEQDATGEISPAATPDRVSATAAPRDVPPPANPTAVSATAMSDDVSPPAAQEDNPVKRPPDTDWNWQLSGPLDMTVDAAVWDVDLFETTPEQISQLQRDGRYVICYFSAGTLDDRRPDIGDVVESTIGLPLDDWPSERWLDIRADSVLELVILRLERAERANCDAVEPDNVGGYRNDSGFPLSESDQARFNTAIATAAHALGLAVGLKNASDLMSALAGEFDFAVTEQCHEFDECELANAFTERGKPVFNAEYPGDESAGSDLRLEVCAEAARLGIHTLILPLDLDASWRISCG